MQITNGGAVNLQSPQTTSASSGSSLDKEIGKDAFLKLLVAQLRNQNPLNPLQGTDFIAQTAQFTSLEQLQQINASLAQLAASSTGGNSVSLDAALASGYLGKVVTANGTIVELEGGSPATLRYHLPVDATVALQISDLQGNSVRMLQLGPRTAGQGEILFDGLDNDGRALPPGRYLYTVTATDAFGGSVAGTGTAVGQVTGITFEGTEPLLTVDGRRIPLSAVSEVSLASQG